MQTCQTKNCGKPVSKPDHKLCLDCWKKSRAAGGTVASGKCQTPGCGKPVSKSSHNLCLECWKKSKHSESAATSPAAPWTTGKCQTKGCENPTRRPNHPLCLDCWKKKHLRKSTPAGQAETVNRAAAQRHISPSEIAEYFGIDSKRINAILRELGWVTRAPGKKGWLISKQGKLLQGKEIKIPKSGIPFVKWPENILENSILCEEVSNYLGENATPDESAASGNGAQAMSDFHDKFPPGDFCATDGHRVRSKAELLIDNFLYTNGIIHAYERKLPVEEVVYCDFYLPTGRVYIEYWGLNDPGYEASKQRKLEVYRRYNLNLIELTDKEVSNLDDHLPRLLLEYEIVVD